VNRTSSLVPPLSPRRDCLPPLSLLVSKQQRSSYFSNSSLVRFTPEFLSTCALRRSRIQRKTVPGSFRISASFHRPFWSLHFETRFLCRSLPPAFSRANDVLCLLFPSAFVCGGGRPLSSRTASDAVPLIHCLLYERKCPNSSQSFPSVFQYVFPLTSFACARPKTSISAV